MASGSLNLITINMILEAAPVQAAGFGTILHLVDRVTNSLDGDRFRSYSGASDVAADLTAGFISTATAAALNTAFTQSPSPSTILAGNVDTVGLETYADGLAAVIAAGAAFYGVTMDDTSAAEILLVSSAVELLHSTNTPKLFHFRSDDADWLTTGYPVAFVALEGKETTVGHYHDSVSDNFPDVGHLAAKLVVDPDSASTAWNGKVLGVAEYLFIPSQAQKDFIRANNMNLGQRWGGFVYSVDAGKNHAGRDISEIITAHWFQVRLNERIEAVTANTWAAGGKIIMGRVGEIYSEGQAMILAECEALLAEGVGTDPAHFFEGTTTAESYAVTATDINLGRLRFKLSAQMTTGARLFVFDVNLFRS